MLHIYVAVLKYCLKPSICKLIDMLHSKIAIFLCVKLKYAPDDGYIKNSVLGIYLPMSWRIMVKLGGVGLYRLASALCPIKSDFMVFCCCSRSKL